MANQAAAGWYTDPNNPAQRRYWDGTKWTEHTDQQAQPQPAQPPQAAPVAPAAQPAQQPQPARPAAPAPEVPPGGYTGPVPPGGWQQPVAQRDVWTGQPLADWGPRVGATLLDALVMIGAVIGLFAPGAILLAAGSDAGGVILLILGGLGYLLVYVFYGAYFMNREGERNGQTLGKQWVGIRVVRDNEQQFDLGSGLVREFLVKNLLFGGLGGFFFGIPWLLDVLWPLWDDQNRALHDMIVKSHVVRA